MFAFYGLDRLYKRKWNFIGVTICNSIYDYNVEYHAHEVTKSEMKCITITPCSISYPNMLRRHIAKVSVFLSVDNDWYW